MIKKVFNKVQQYITGNYKSFIILIIMIFLVSIKFPYYIDAPGGLINLNDRIQLKNGYESSGNFYLTYVKEYEATLPTLFIALINSEWNVYKESEIVADNETIKDLQVRERLMSKEANQNATIVGLTKANQEINITKRTVYVTYISGNATTTLKIGDELVSINNIDINGHLQLKSEISKYEEGTIVNIVVKRNNKLTTTKSTIKEYEDNKIIGFSMLELKEYTTDIELEILTQQSELGPSGGLMTALQIYDELTSFDLTRGLKVAGTGTIDENGLVDSIGGVEYKIRTAVKNKVDVFFIPSGENYEEAVKLINEEKYKLNLIPVSNIDEAIEYLTNYNG